MAEEDIYLPPVNLDRCTYCKSTSIVKHVKIDQTADAGNIGLRHKTRFIICAVEPFFADVCDNCGSVLRIFVDKPRKQWILK